MIRLGPGRLLPPPDVPLVELGILGLTVALLATFSRYAAMCFSTDAKGVVQKLEEIARLDAAARASDRESLKTSFQEQTDRIIAKSAEQIAATTTGLSEISTRLQNVADAIEKQLRISEEAKRAAERATAAQEATLAEVRNAEATRRQEVLAAAQARTQRIAPRLSARFHYEGTLFHHLVVDIYNGGFDARGLAVQVAVAGGQSWQFSDAGLASKTSKSYQVVALSDLPDMTAFAVTASISDIDGATYHFSGPTIQYKRETGFLRRTKAVYFSPPGWQAMTATGMG